MDRTHYEVLGVNRGTAPDELKARWRELAFQLHPDREGGSQEEFSRVSGAYAVLSDSKRRAAYDKELALLRPACPACKGEGFTWKQKGIKHREVSTCSACKGSGRTERRKR